MAAYGSLETIADEVELARLGSDEAAAIHASDIPAGDSSDHDGDVAFELRRAVIEAEILNPKFHD